jgi:RecB family exonuclease
LDSTFGWSISSLGILNQCGYLWKLKYRTDIKPESGRDLPAYAFGRAVHKAIEEVHLQQLWDVREWMPVWEGIWAEQSKDVDWEAWPGRKRNSERLGPDILAAYTEREENYSAQIECLEQRFDIEIEGVKVKGVIDQIRKQSDGSLLLIDFKTSKEPSHPLVERADPQLTLYAEVCRLLYDQMPTVAHYYLRTGSLVCTERNEGDIESVLGMVREAQQRVDAEMFTRQLGWQCNSCEYRTPCLTSLAS